MELSDLKKPFPPDRISWRVGSQTKDKKKGMALAYIDARDVQDRLDEVCGVDGWQCRYVPMHDKKTVCEIGIRIFRPSLGPETALSNVASLVKQIGHGIDEWVWKSDGAGDTDVEAEKGSLSDAFKRAAVRWGIGRYLYDVEAPWVELEAFGNPERPQYKIAAKEYARLESLLNLSKPGSYQNQAGDGYTQPAGQNISHSITAMPTTTPAEWTKKAIARVKGFKTRKELDEFEEKYHLKIAKVRPVEPVLHEQLIAVMRRRHGEFAG